MDEERGHEVGFGKLSVMVLAFFGAWVYAIAHYGLLLGGLAGWLPAALIAVAALWAYSLSILWSLLGLVYLWWEVVAYGI